MLASINNYKVKRLLLNGHYVCTSDQDSTSLLCMTLTKRSLRNYRNLYLESVVFPTQITCLSEGETYDCYPLRPGLSLGMTRLQTRLYSSSQLTVLFLSLCKVITQVLQHDLLRKQVSVCLTWDNVWIQNDKVVLMWYADKKCNGTYREEDLMDKLLDILITMHSATGAAKKQEPCLLKLIVDFAKTNSGSTAPLRDLVDYLTQMVISKVHVPFKMPKFFSAKMGQRTQKNRYTIDHTQNSLQKSLRFVKSKRKRTIEVGDMRKYTSRKVGKLSLFENSQRLSYSPCDHKFRDNSMTKSMLRQNYHDGIELKRSTNDRVHISNMLRTRAIEAFQSQRNQSIDVSKYSSDTKVCPPRKLTFQTRLLQERDNLVGSFKHNTRFTSKAKEGTIPRILHKSKMSDRLAMHIQLSGQGKIDFSKSEQRNLHHHSDKKVVQQQNYLQKQFPSIITRQTRPHLQRTEKQYVSPMISLEPSQRRTTQPVCASLRLGNQDAEAQSIGGKSNSLTYDLKTLHKQQAQVQPELRETTRFQYVKQPHRQESTETGTNESKYELQSGKELKAERNFKKVKITETYTEQIQEIFLHNPKYQSKQTQKHSEEKRTSPSTIQQKHTLNVALNTSQQPQNNNGTPGNQAFKSSKLLRKSSLKVKTQSSQSVTIVQPQVEDYITLINLMGQAVGKSQKVCKTFQSIDWFTGIYFLYKRFLQQRRKIQMWLDEGIMEFRRESQPKMDKGSFEKWLSTQSRNTILAKIKRENSDIEKAIVKMYKTLAKKCINSKILQVAKLQNTQRDASLILMEYALNQVDAVLAQLPLTPDISMHLIQLLDALFVVAQLDNTNVEYRVSIADRRAMSDPVVYLANLQAHLQQLDHWYPVQ